MTPRPPLARAATDLLAGEDQDVRAPSPEDEAAAIARIAEAIEASARARRRRKWALGAAALVAAAAGTALLVGHAPTSLPRAATTPTRSLQARVSTTRGGVSLSRGNVALEVRSEILHPNDRLSTADGTADVSISTGTQLVLEGNSDLTVVEQGLLEMYSLARGSVRARVAKLEGAERFMVHTPDADIEVRGTEFRVSIVAPDPACGGGTTTRLEVTEGHVVVRSDRGEAHVLKGETWPRGCATPAARAALSTAALVTPEAPPAPPAPPAPQASTVSTVAVSAAPGAAPAGSARASSDLATQTAILAEATAARRRGANSEALAAYERLIARYPASPLVETAYAERMRLLAKTDRPRAGAAAKDYLARFPRGYARDEAASLAGAP